MASFRVLTCLTLVYSALHVTCSPDDEASRILLPSLTGPYPIGASILHLTDHNRLDPFAPTPNTPRSLMVTLFYPTILSPTEPICPAFPPRTASFLDTRYAWPVGTTARLISRAHLNAPLAHPDAPILLFSPGFTGMREEYTILTTELASRGFMVAAMDHPYDSAFVEYPDGRVAMRDPGMMPGNYTGGALGALYMRVGDARFVLDVLANATVLAGLPGMDMEELDQVQGQTRLQRPRLRTDRVGILGHSFGGATTTQTMFNDSRFVAGVSIDGGVMGPVRMSGLSQPVMFIGRENNTRMSSPGNGWATFWNASVRNFGESYRREMMVRKTVHLSFTDYPGLLDATELGKVAPRKMRDRFGKMDGLRVRDIQSEYIGSFFEKWLMGDERAGRLLDGPSKEFPEVSLQM